MDLTISALLFSRPSMDIKWTWPRILLDGLGLGEDGVDKVSDLRSSDRSSKLCERRPESTMEGSVSGEGAFLELFSVLRPLSDPGPAPMCCASARERAKM